MTLYQLPLYSAIMPAQIVVRQIRLVSWYRLFHDFIRFAIKFPIYVSPVAGVDFSDVHPASDFCHLHGLFASVGANLENAVENESGLDFVNPLFRLLRIGFEPRFQPADRCPRFGSLFGGLDVGHLALQFGDASLDCLPF